MSGDAAEPELLIDDQVVTIIVGPESLGTDRQRYVLHKKVLCSKSDFFRAAFRGPSKEATENKMTLPEESPKAFRMFVSWLYTNSVPVSWFSSESASADHIKSATKSDVETVLELYLMGQKWLIPTLQDKAIDILIGKFSIRPLLFLDADIIIMVYSSTMEKSKIRNFLVQLFVYLADDSGNDLTSLLSIHNDFTMSVATVLYQATRNKLRFETHPSQDLRCHYHAHDEDFDCPYKAIFAAAQAQKVAASGGGTGHAKNPRKRNAAGSNSTAAANKRSK
ncbi:MAG: hypothetical protein M1834_009577 [Cirrosporium novae-zelandiae]|nr:MAG: hypothetical protein M1834_009577 [Cirrosporium novae-zelandiae]